jgi:putative ABC transport system permease protein
VLIAGLSIFAALYNAMETRQYDLAILSALGASRARVISLLWLEALLLALAGTLLGLLLGHAGVELAGRLLPDLPLSGRRWVAAEWGLLGLALGVATLSALLPALRAHRTDVAAVLSRG